MDTPLNASSTTAGALMAGSRFTVPQFQREYAWDRPEVDDFWADLQRSVNDDSYFLGLIILTGQGPEKDVVDGQQRLLTLTLLVAALYHEAAAAKRRALADRLQSNFLRYIEFDTDEEVPRLKLANSTDNTVLESILSFSARQLDKVASNNADESITGLLLRSYRILSDGLHSDLRQDPFKRLGEWADFLTNKLYFAVFIHPDPSSAYKVFEVINTRGKELTTADLLKSFVLSQTAPQDRENRYTEWQYIAGQFFGDNGGQFVQFIRHAVTTKIGHIPPKDLYDVLAGRVANLRGRISPPELMNLLQTYLPLYLQMTDPTVEGPANEEQLGIFSALNSLGVIAVRPILLAIFHAPNPTAGMQAMLKIVVRRIVVGNLGTGNVERRFGQAAQRITENGDWKAAVSGLEDLSPDREDFATQLRRRSLNKNVLSFMRRSILQDTTIPLSTGFLHFIRPRDVSSWPEFSEDRAAYWVSTVGNTFLSMDDRRPNETNTWEGVKTNLFPTGLPEERIVLLENFESWTEQAVESVGTVLAQEAAVIWYE